MRVEDGQGEHPQKERRWPRKDYTKVEEIGFYHILQPENEKELDFCFCFVFLFLLGNYDCHVWEV